MMPSASPLLPIILLLRRRRPVSPYTPPIPDAVDFYTAFLAMFNSDSDLISAFPGGLVDQNAAGGSAYPYARFSRPKRVTPETNEDQRYMIAIRCYANGPLIVSGVPVSGGTPDDAARSVATLFQEHIDDTGNRPPVSFSGWVETCHIPQEDQDDFGMLTGADGLQVCHATFAYIFGITQSNLQHSQ